MNDIEYESIRALNYTGAKEILRSPLAYKTWLETEVEETPALRMGRLCHLASLQPDVYLNSYKLAPECDRRTKDGKEIWSNFVNTLKLGQEAISQNDYEIVNGVAKSARAGFDLVTDKNSEWIIEKPIFKKFEGIDIKGRPDLVVGDVVIDLKTTNDVLSFGRTVADYKYYMQVAWYLELTGLKRFVFIAIEKTAPFDFALFELDAEAIEEGRKLMSKACALYGQCNMLKTFPGYDKTIQTLSLPKYLISK